MFDNKTKEEIFQYITQVVRSHGINENLSELCCAIHISQELHISRNLASQYCNELFYEGCLVKVLGRPTSFLPKQDLETMFQHAFASTYDNMEDFMETTKQTHQDEGIFNKLVGYNSSLSYEIEQCKAAVNYPGNGLPVLLYGATGTGKSYIASLLFEYSKGKGLIGDDGVLVNVNCAEYASNAEFFLTNLFGYKKGSYTGAEKDNFGLLAIADKGMLFFDEVHSLTPECQEKLFLFMDQGIYHMVGDNKKWYRSNVRFVFATTENPEKSLLKTLLRRIPITVKIPPLKERPLNEKRQLIQMILKRESETLNKPIQISQLAFQTLENYDFNGNVGELKNCLKISVANAYLKIKADDQVIQLYWADLPANIVKNRTDVSFQADENQRMLNLLDLKPKNSTDAQYLILFQSIMQYYQQHLEGKMDQDTFFNCIDLRLEQYVHFLFYEENPMVSPKEDIIASVLMNMNKVLMKKTNTNELSNNEIKILTKYFNHIISNGIICSADMKKKQEIFTKLDDMLKQDYLKEHLLAKELISYMQNSLNTRFDRFEVMVVYFFLRYFHRELQTYKIPVIILAHGYSIASGIAELANQLLHCNIFTAIDMPIESHFDIMTSKLREYIQKIRNVQEVIVMVDMGSLEEFHNYIENFTDLDVGIINNVTTKLALDIGSMIMNDYSMQKILEEAKKRSEPNYVIVRKRNRKKAILTVCASGYGIACKFAALLENSFPKKLDIEVIPVASESLNSQGNQGVFEKYDVILMVGTLESRVPQIPFLSIEDMINQGDGLELSKQLGSLMSENELAIFNQNIIKNFSLDNLLDYLTILNPEKIIGFVEEIVRQIEKKMNQHFNNTILIGLYLHISCLIERLILEKQLIYHRDMSDFKKEQEEFIVMIQEVFKGISETYNVIIPIEEIEYIYNYVHQKKSVEERERSVEKEKKRIDSLMEEIGFSE